MKKGIYLILTICVVGFIWHNSLQDAVNSEQRSIVFAAIAQRLLLWIGVSLPMSEADHLVRKLAHMTEFAGLGFFLRLTVGQFRLQGWRAWGGALCLGLLAAGMDEFLQQFSVGRSSQLSDVGIDFIGVCAGCLMAAAFCWGVIVRRRGLLR